MRISIHSMRINQKGTESTEAISGIRWPDAFSFCGCSCFRPVNNPFTLLQAQLLHLVQFSSQLLHSGQLLLRTFAPGRGPATITHTLGYTPLQLACRLGKLTLYLDAGHVATPFLSGGRRHAHRIAPGWLWFLAHCISRADAGKQSFDLCVKRGHAQGVHVCLDLAEFSFSLVKILSVDKPENGMNAISQVVP